MAHRYLSPRLGLLGTIAGSDKTSAKMTENNHAGLLKRTQGIPSLHPPCACRCFSIWPRRDRDHACWWPPLISSLLFGAECVCTLLLLDVTVRDNTILLCYCKLLYATAAYCLQGTSTTSKLSVYCTTAGTTVHTVHYCWYEFACCCRGLRVARVSAVPREPTRERKG